MVGGILAAYIEAQRTGRGKRLEGSLLRTGIFALGTDLSLQIMRGRVGSTQPRRQNVNPYHGFYPTKDGRWMAVSLGRASNLPATLGHPELAGDPRFANAKTRRAHGAEIVDLFDAIFRERTMEEWSERFRDADFPWAPVQNAAEVVADPQAQAAGAFTEVPLKVGGSYRGVAMPVGFFNPDGTSDGLPKRDAPGLGEHTDDLLVSLGYRPERIAQLRNDAVIG
jgi:crotonobetainyl-CoA:carnitine CoA-transferase CaiB-like acyl-CoA transferase